MEIPFIVFNGVAIPALAPLVLGIIRKVKARMQSRVGASVLQPYRDLGKLFQKNEVVSEDASWLFLSSPYIVFGSTVALSWGIALLGGVSAYAPLGDLLVFVYVGALGTFFLALSGMDTGGGFGGFGASREMMIAALAEGGMLLSLVAAAFLAHTPYLASMPGVLAELPLSGLLPLALAGAAFFIALLAENARYPVDNPATHLELTMVHEALILEHSGRGLALMEWASATKLVVFIAVFVTVFLSWLVGAPALSSPLAAMLTSFSILLAAIIAVAVVIACIESTMAKFRIFRVPDFLLTSLVLSVIAIILIVL